MQSGGTSYGEIHHARLRRLLNILALGYLGVGIELYNISYTFLSSCLWLQVAGVEGSGAYVEQVVV
jgi:hypothetical protein